VLKWPLGHAQADAGLAGHTHVSQAMAQIKAVAAQVQRLNETSENEIRA
jgi:hypothetical protein